MKVFVDTTTFRSNEFDIDSADLVALESSIEAGFQLQLPAVVLKESKNQISEIIKAQSKKYESARRNLCKLTTRLSPEPISVEVLDDAIENSQGLFEYGLVGMGFRIIPLPDLNVEEILERDLARKKPFSVSGKGFRDTLIWETIKFDCLGQDGEVVFITGNIKDFGPGPLHPTLQKEIEGEAYSITVLESVDEFIDKFVSPRTKAVAHLIGTTLEGELGDYLEHRIYESVCEEMDWEGALFLGEPVDSDSGAIKVGSTKLDDLEIGEISSAAQLPDGKTFVVFNCRASYELGSDAPDDYKELGRGTVDAKVRTMVDPANLKVYDSKVLEIVEIWEDW